MILSRRLRLIFTNWLVVACAVLLENCVTGQQVESASLPARNADRNPATQTERSPKQPPESAPRKQLFRGKVVLLVQALKRRGIKVSDEMKGQVALETKDGEIIPIAADWRGRAFYQDQRLRDRLIELVGFRKEGVPYLQVILVYTFDKKGVRLETDYWCDTCAIALYQIQECECCQEPIRLRYRPAELPEYLDQVLPAKAADTATGADTTK